MRGRLSDIDRLRGWRVRERDVTIGNMLSGIQRDLKQSARREAAAEDAWRRVLPDALAMSVAGGAISRMGVLTLRMSDAAAKYELNRWIRDGGERALRGACPNINKVRVR